MGSKQGSRGHTGHTQTGYVRDVRIERIGRVTIYERGKSYFLYYREQGRSIRRKVDGNLASARALASRTTAALSGGDPSPFDFNRTTIVELVDGFWEHCQTVQELAPRTVTGTGRR